MPKKILKTTPILLILLATTITPLTTPINTTIIIPLSKSEPVEYTTMKIKALLPNALVLKPSDLLYKLYLWRNLGEVIYVSHGTEKGIVIEDKVVKWDSFTATLRKTRASTILIASCYSQRAVEEARKMGLKKNLYGFKDYVDVDEAAYTTAAIANYLHGNYLASYRLYAELTKIMIGKIIEPWKYNLWLLYYTKEWRNIWWVKWSDSYLEYVEYTHADIYTHYQIGVNEWKSLRGDNIEVQHIPKYVLDTLSLAGILSIGISSSALGYVIGKYLTKEAIKLLAELIVGVIVTIVEVAVTAIIEIYLRDELDGGWIVYKDLEYSTFLMWLVYLKCDIKIGELMWLRVLYPSVGNPFGVYPLWYGGRALGHGGI